MVDFQIDDLGIARIRFETAQQNALTSADLQQLKENILACSENEAVKVILLLSGGNQSFCAGANFKELISIKTEAESKAFFMGFGGVILAIRACSKIVVGRIQGKAVGGGVGLAAACDYVVATDGSEVRLSELNIGLGPFVIGPMVERKIGLSGFTSLSLNPRVWRSAQWAAEKGLYNDVYTDIANVDAHLEALLHDLAGLSSQAKAEVKRMCWEGTESWPELLEKRAEMSGKLLLSEDCQQQIQSFLAKSKS